MANTHLKPLLSMTETLKDVVPEINPEKLVGLRNKARGANQAPRQEASKNRNGG
ncbi:MAG: hypothetical protein WCC14_21685 [Acidobacteriaceae bacterium]